MKARLILMLNKILLVVVCVMFAYLPIVSDNINTIAVIRSETGLSFLAHSEIQEKRTSMRLGKDDGLSIKKGTKIEFDLKLKRESEAYGYVFRMIFDNTNSFDLISNFHESKIDFKLLSSNVLKHQIEFPNLQVSNNEWLAIKIQLNENNIICSINGQEQSIPFRFPSDKKASIIFGRNNHPLYSTKDVAPVTIKNIAIKNKDNEIQYFWRLDKHQRDIVYDEINETPAYVSNGVWDIDHHYEWKKINFLLTDFIHPQIAYDSRNGKVFVVEKSKIYVMNLNSNSVDTITVKSGYPILGEANQLVFNAKSNSLISYTIQSNKISIFNFNDLQWSESENIANTFLQDHNRFIDTINNRLLLFGGYGRLRFNSDIYIYDFYRKEWSSQPNISCMSPRCLSSLAQKDDSTILILGGQGTLSGNQEDSPRSYYDLYTINTNTLKCEQLWESINIDNHLTFGNSMIIDSNYEKIYALAFDNYKYNSDLFLMSIDLNTKSYSIVSDSIPYKFNDTQSYSDIFKHNESNSLIAIVLQPTQDNKRSIELYSLAAPPLAYWDIYQSGKMKAANQKLSIFLWLFGSILSSSFLLFIIVQFRKRKREKKAFNNEIDNNFVEKIQDSISDDIELKNEQFLINLLGGFHVFNNKREDITTLFSPTLKQLLLILLLNSASNNKGVTSDYIDSIIWNDMNKKNAINNRGVNIRKLRVLLDEISDIKIQHKNSYWKLNIKDTSICDYSHVMRLLHKIKETKLNNIKEIVNVASSGRLLPSLDFEWLDEFKSEYSQLLFDTLLFASKDTEISQDINFLLKISDVILLQDNTDEEGIKLKCNALYLSGQKSLSKHHFDKFVVNYQELLGVEPDFDYEDIILHNNK